MSRQPKFCGYYWQMITTNDQGTAMGNVDTLNLIQDSLLRRMRTMHSLYYQAVSTMELHHVNHFERGRGTAHRVLALPLHQHAGRHLHGNLRRTAHLE